MRNISLVFSFIFFLFVHFECLFAQQIRTGADRIDEYLPILNGKRVALVVNHTSVVESKDGRLVADLDTLISRGVDVHCVMAPEHGYNGKAGAGEHLTNGADKKSGIKIFSLYGKTRKPLLEWLDDIDIVVFDLQDVGTRFYTYLSTMKNVLDACGENGKTVMILDRPNPNDTIDGPLLEEKFMSFVGSVPVPILHGCTLGELAQMIVGEEWIAKVPSLIVVPCAGWKHRMPYNLKIAPSPNLPNNHAIALYPSLCLFEGTSVSVGRGTDSPFEVFGHPQIKSDFSFVPKPSESNRNPLQNGKTCYGMDLRNVHGKLGFDLSYLEYAFKQLGKSMFLESNFFELLAGTDKLKQQIIDNVSSEEIRNSWQEDLAKYKELRSKYLIYK